MSTLDDVVAESQVVSDKLDTLVAKVAKLQSDLAAALAGDPAAQAKVEAVFAQLKSDEAKEDAANAS